MAPRLLVAAAVPNHQRREGVEVAEIDDTSDKVLERLSEDRTKRDPELEQFIAERDMEYVESVIEEYRAADSMFTPDEVSHLVALAADAFLLQHLARAHRDPAAKYNNALAERVEQDDEHRMQLLTDLLKSNVEATHKQAEALLSEHGVSTYRSKIAALLALARRNLTP